MIHQFDCCFATYQDGDPTPPADALRRSGARVESRYLVEREEARRRLAKSEWSSPYLLAYRDIARATDERTWIAAAIPLGAADDTVRLVFVAPQWGPQEHLFLLSQMNSFVADYCIRMLVGSNHVAEFVAMRAPVLPADTLKKLAKRPLPFGPEAAPWIVARAAELSGWTEDLDGLVCALSLGRSAWDPARRFLLRAELDAAFFHLYGISRDDADYILETFPIVKRNDEKAHGEFRTKRVILEIYDAMAEAVRTGKPYQTRLDPPPAGPRVAHRESSRPKWAGGAAEGTAPAAPRPASKSAKKRS